jgi:hypothetical protein
VTDGANIQMRLLPLEFLLAHLILLFCLSHYKILFDRQNSGAFKFRAKPRSGIEPLTSSLPRTCSTN